MIIKATTTNPATRFCTMAATPGELMNKATGANSGDQRRGSAPSRADHGAGAEMISERSRSQREHNRRPDGSANLCRDAQIRCAIRSRVFENSPFWPASRQWRRAVERDLDDQLLVHLPAGPSSVTSGPPPTADVATAYALFGSGPEADIRKRLAYGRTASSSQMGRSSS